MKSSKTLPYAFLVSALFVSACSLPTNDPNKGTSDTYELTTVPAGIRIDIPASLVPAASSPGARAAGAGDVYTEMSIGMARSMVGMLDSMGSSVSMMLVLGDYIIDRNDLSPDGTPHLGIAVALTQALFDRMLAVSASDMRDGFDSSIIGSSLTMDVTYSQAAAPYAFALEIYESRAPMPVTLSWSEDKTKSKVAIASMEITYDAATKTMALRSTDDYLDFTMNLKQAADGGAYVAFSFGSGEYAYSVKCYADDDGGYITAEYPDYMNEGMLTASACSFNADGVADGTVNTFYQAIYDSAADEFYSLEP